MKHSTDITLYPIYTGSVQNKLKAQYTLDYEKISNEIVCFKTKLN